MEIKKKIVYAYSILVFGSWLVALLTIYPPTAKLFYPIVPRASFILTIFLAMTALSSVTSLLIGFGLFSIIKNKMKIKLVHTLNLKKPLIE
jgi:hypothetical protein